MFSIATIQSLASDALVASEVPSTDEGLRSLAARGMNSLSFFLSSITPGAWVPRIVLVRAGREMLGALLLKERRIGRIPSGLLYGDATLDNLLISSERYREAVFETALGHMLSCPGVGGIRLALPPSGYEARCLPAICEHHRFAMFSRASTNHLSLPLQPVYEQFVDSLGSKTRRNVRYYRRRAETLGHQYVHRMDDAQFQSAITSLLSKGVTGASHEGVRRALRIFAAVERPIFSGLRGRDGEWLAVLGGWYDAHRAVLFLQMNAELQRPTESLSLVLRAHFIENLIADGVRSLLFWAGVGLPFSRYCTPVPTQRIYLDSMSIGWRATRSIVKWSASLLPTQASGITEWIVPMSQPEKSENGPL